MILSGKNCVITGANTGLGLAVAKKFAKQDAQVIMVCRNEARGQKAAAEIKRESPQASVELMVCDLASMKSVEAFISAFKQRYSKLDILFNNAAVMKQKRTITEDGLEMMFQVNYLAPFILMNAFQDVIKKSSTHLILNNGRPADKLRLDFDDLQFAKNYNMYNSFFKTKLCLLLASLELSRRHERDTLTVIMADPGPFKSALVRDVPWFGWVKNLFSAPVEKAAENILYVVTTAGLKGKTGKVFEKRAEKPLIPYWQDEEVSQHLWSITQTMLADIPQIDQAAGLAKVKFA